MSKKTSPLSLKTSPLPLPVSSLPNGFRVRVDEEGGILIIDFLGSLDRGGTPLDILGSYALPFNRVEHLVELISTAIASANRKKQGD